MLCDHIKTCELSRKLEAEVIIVIEIRDRNRNRSSTLLPLLFLRWSVLGGGIKGFEGENAIALGCSLGCGSRNSYQSETRTSLYNDK